MLPGIANIGDVSLHARFKAALASLDIRAMRFYVIRTGLGRLWP